MDGAYLIWMPVKEQSSLKIYLYALLLCPHWSASALTLHTLLHECSVLQLCVGYGELIQHMRKLQHIIKHSLKSASQGRRQDSGAKEAVVARNCLIFHAFEAFLVSIAVWVLASLNLCYWKEGISCSSCSSMLYSVSLTLLPRPTCRPNRAIGLVEPNVYVG